MTEDASRLLSRESEMALLGAMIFDPGEIDSVLSRVTVADFAFPQHVHIFRTLVDLHTRNQPIDLVLLRDAIASQGLLVDVGGAEYLMGLVDGVPNAANAPEYAAKVKGYALERSLHDAAKMIVDRPAGLPWGGELENLKTLAEKIEECRRGAVKVERDEMGLKQYGAAVRLDTIAPPTEPRKLSWGVPALDAITDGGVAHRRLTLVIMDTGVGKSRLCKRLAITAVEEGYKVVLMSTELTPEDGRMMIDSAGEGESLKGIYFLADSSLEQFRQAVQTAMDDSKDGKVLAIIDVLQDVEGPPHPDGRVDLGLEAISKALADLANEHDIPAVLTSQVSRASIKRGMDVHAAAGGNVERKASTVIVGVQPCPGEIEITVHKLRWGEKGKKVHLVVDYPALEFAPGSPTDLSGLTSDRKGPKTSTMEKLVELVCKLHGTKDEWGNLIAGMTYDFLAGQMKISADSVRKSARVAAAAHRLRIVEGNGRSNQTQIFPPLL